MSDNEGEDEKPFCVERAKQGRAKCKKCKQNCLSGELRIAKLAKNPFGDGNIKMWHHLPCMFEQFLTQRLTTKRLENYEDLSGWDTLGQEDKDEITKCMEEFEKNMGKKYGAKYSPPKKPAVIPKKKINLQKNDDEDEKVKLKKTNSQKKDEEVMDNVQEDKDHKDNSFREFRRLVAEITNESSYLEKSAIIKNMFTKGSDGKCFKGDVILWCKLLLPGVIKRIYNLQSKQLVKLFSEMFNTNREEMLEHLEQGDIGETIQNFFETSNGVKPSKKSKLTIFDVDDFLEELSQRTKEDEQIDHFKKLLKKCTPNDLKVVIRLIKHDLRMNAGAKHVLDGVDSNAYESFQASRDITKVLKQFLDKNNRLSTSHKTKPINISINVMTPVLPMLAEACKSVEQAMKKCPNGMYSEIKYDGERVQVHKHGTDFRYYSRSLKPVLPHKVSHFKKYIPEAFPYATDLILDSEVLLIDTTNGKPLPFGSLGKHKKHEFKDANVCLFVFDCLYYNGESLMHKSIKERREILNENMKEIPNHIMFSEMEEVDKAGDLAAMIAKVLKLGLEGLVLKDKMSIYEPGKRHWLKVKKDYLCDGAMADSADLIVLGAWFGTGKKGGMMSVFLMGCYDKYTNKFCTVTKVHTGHDDKTLERLQSELDMVKISCEVSKVPDWLKCTRSMVPDFVAKDPKKQPIWEITGAEFTQHEVHTADGISIRFPRVTRIRSDKTWETATNLKELKQLFKNSNENIDYSKLLKTEIIDEEISHKVESKSPLLDDKTENKQKRKHVSEEVDIEPQPGCSNNDIKQENDVVPKKKLRKGEIEIRYPDIFANINILPQDSVRTNYEDLLRHFIAYGGNILNSESVKYVVHENNTVSNMSAKDFPQSVRHITADWIKDCIGNKELQNTKPYTVKWFPK